jgi:predicted phosphodiesterase
MHIVGVIPDLHNPWTRKGSLRFVRQQFDKHKVERVVFLGDIIDSAAISFHVRNPNMPSALEEYKLAYRGVKRWYSAFPEADVTVGNHDSRNCRVGASVGLPSLFLQTFNKLYETPDWRWHTQIEIDDVLYLHGDGFGGQYPWAAACRRLGQSCVIGHTHSKAGIDWIPNQRALTFGFGAGCLIDDKEMCFQYAHARQNRSLLGCGIVKHGVPLWIPMDL